jgi:hypothetical protein
LNYRRKVIAPYLSDVLPISYATVLQPCNCFDSENKTLSRLVMSLLLIVVIDILKDRHNAIEPRVKVHL